MEPPLQYMPMRILQAFKSKIFENISDWSQHIERKGVQILGIS